MGNLKTVILWFVKAKGLRFGRKEKGLIRGVRVISTLLPLELWPLDTERDKEDSVHALASARVNTRCSN